MNAASRWSGSRYRSAVRRGALLSLAGAALLHAACGSSRPASPEGAGTTGAGAAGGGGSDGRGGDAGARSAGRAGAASDGGGVEQAGGESGAAGANDSGGNTGGGGASGGGVGIGGRAGSPAAGAAGRGDVDCSLQVVGPATAKAARSLGWSGTDDDYSALYSVECTADADCVPPCERASGTEESCAIGSSCPESSTARTCLPPTYFRNVAGATSPSLDTAGAAVLTLVEIDYLDSLIVSDFGLALPEGATVRGVQFLVRRASEASLATDESVRLVTAGRLVGADRKQDGAWPTTLSDATYGAEDDDWDAGLSATELESATFGLSITPVYTGTAGNDRAYVDSVVLYAYYTAPGCP